MTSAKSNKPEGTSMIFYNTDNQVLMFLRDNFNDIPFPNHWDLLGGNVEDHETPKECIIREMKEEIEIDLIDPELFSIYEIDGRTEHTFIMKKNIDISQVRLNEGQRLRWFSNNEIINMPESDIAFNFKHVLLDFYSELKKA